MYNPGRLFILLVALHLLCSICYGSDSLTFNEEAKVTGVNRAHVKFYSLEEKFEKSIEVPFQESLCEYDKNGNIIAYTEYSVETKYIPADNRWEILNEPVIQEIRYEYDDAGKLISKKELGEISKYIYDGKDRLIEVRIFNDDTSSSDRGKITTINSYVYDNNGNCIEEIIKKAMPLSYEKFYTDGSIIHEYDATSKEIRVGIPVLEESTGKRVGIEYTCFYAYDIKGRLSKEQFCRGHGQPEIYQVNYYTYDDQGRIATKVSRWKPDEDKYATSTVVGSRAEYAYGKNGNVVREDSYSIIKDDSGEHEKRGGYFEVEYDPAANRLFIEDRKK